MTTTPATERIAAVALKAFWRIAERWGLSTNEAAVLLGLSETSVALTQTGDLARVTPETLVRIGHMLAIFKALHGLLPEPQADDWVRLINTREPFAGTPALQRMLRGGIGDLVATRGYVESHLYR